MNRLGAMPLFILLAAFCAPCAARPRPSPRFTVHFICFTAVSRPGTVVGPWSPRWLQTLQTGDVEPRLSLGVDADAFISKLRTLDPDYTFERQLAGSVVTGDKGHCAFTVSDPGPLRFALTCEMVLKPSKWAPLTQVDIPSESGVVTWKAPANPVSWHGNEIQWLGRTFTAAATVNDTHGIDPKSRIKRYYICAFSIVRGQDIGTESPPGRGRSDSVHPGAFRH